jgi:integral membrane protein
MTVRRTVSKLAPGYARPGDVDDPLRGLPGSLLRYRVMAYIVGIGLLVLCAVGLPLQYVGGHPVVDQVVGPIHGFLYIVYLLAAVDLARRARFTLVQMAAMIGAGFCPFLAFVIEHFVVKRVRARIADLSAGGAAAAAATP